MTHERLVRHYFTACSEGDPSAVAACFTADAVVYDVNHRPVVGSDAIGAFYRRVREQWAGATWHVDTWVGDGDAAAIEWTMRGHHEGVAFAARGSEHYRFADTGDRGEDARIAEIRQYWAFDPTSPATALRGFDYDAHPHYMTG